jgi:TRAP-type C4-dicarboxylate transport system permease small subunit
MASDSRRPLPPNPSPAAPPAGEVPPRSLFGGFTRILNVLGTLLILVMALAVNADVIGRNLFLFPLPGVLEFVGLSIVAIVFLQMANTLREDRHVANDILMRVISRTRPRLTAAFYMVFYLIGAVLMALIVWFVWPILVDNYRGGYYRGTIGVVTIPTWPFIAPVVIGAAATCIQFLLLAHRAFLRAAGRRPA